VDAVLAFSRSSSDHRIMYRDDATAAAERLATLERTAVRVERLEDRIRELEDENRELRAALARTAPPGAERDGWVSFDTHLESYVRGLVTATRFPPFAEQIVSGVLPVDEMRIAEAAKARARTAHRNFATPNDVRAAAREVLGSRLMFRRDVDGAATIERLLERVASP